MNEKVWIISDMLIDDCFVKVNMVVHTPVLDLLEVEDLQKIKENYENY